MNRICLAIALILASSVALTADKNEKEEAFDASKAFSGLKLRMIGPAITSGRITDFAFHPERKQEFYVATASGGLWKTTDNGIRWKPIFDGYDSYSIGTVALDPRNPAVVWVGTGENNSQRSVAYGDGVYLSRDGGKKFERVGLENSEHISQIGFHPEEPDTVFVASQGPLWNEGGDRGLYKTEDRGKTWTRILNVDEHTGVNEFAIHPTDPRQMVASSYQRRRHVWTLINGGPGSGIHKSRDGGKTWERIARGLPKGDLGRIGLAMAPSNPNILYAIIEASAKGQGIYRSVDFGETWTKRSSHISRSPQYYQELVIDPKNPDRLYSLDVQTAISEDGGKTWKRLSLEARHVDDHALWIDPDETNHLIIGGDGGIYESWDRGRHWRHYANLPITQFYRATPDNDLPFYNVYGGTQDNNTLGAPARTTSIHGITNADWTRTLGGDGFKPQIDPTDPSIVYSQYQHGGLARFDRRTGERVYITPQPDSGEDALRWNWNSPLIISPHDPSRLYYGCQKIYRSDDRGNSWRAISDDLSRPIDRNKLEIMGRVWGVDSISKNRSTSIYGSLIAIDESPLVEGLIYAGTDDGLIHVTEDGGQTWRTNDGFGEVPDMSLVEDIIAGLHDANTAYAVFDNHKRGDFAPYVYKTTDRGKTWRSITSDLPKRGTAHTIIEDHVDANLLFVGTEFGLYFTRDGGGSWHELTGNFPTIAVRDLEIQRREEDLVVGTFGRGIYILDDISPLRVSDDQLAKPHLFPVKDALLYIPWGRWGGSRKGSLGDAFYSADNPPFGAIFTFSLDEARKTRKQRRRDAEKKIERDGGDVHYPSWDELRKEDQEESPVLFLTVRDESGAVVRRIAASNKKGIHRVAWDLRLDSPVPVDVDDDLGDASGHAGPLALPGRYEVSLSQRVEGTLEPLSAPQTFSVVPLDQGAPTADRKVLMAFQQKTSRLQRAVRGSISAMAEIEDRIEHLIAAAYRTPQSTEDQAQRLRELQSAMASIRIRMTGDRTKTSRYESAPWPIQRRVNSIVFGHWSSQSEVTQTHRKAYEIAAEEFRVLLGELKSVENSLVAMEDEFEEVLAPWTPGRIPNFSPE